ncbi:MAG: DUF1800 family protein [Saprospiraceae bacterium]|jgi:uncharacterized protein (DUF1800 family)|nr:DUF1800 family protein [Saprospiraceae bacterium]
MASLAPLSGSLGHRRAAHLLRRASYRYTKAKVDQLAGMSADQAVASLLVTPALQIAQPVYDNPGTTGVENTTWINPPGQTLPAEDFVLRRYVMGWWVNEALHDPGISHKMAFFLHQHMIVTANTYGNTHFFDYLSLMRWASLGNFKKLATKIVTDNTMLIYLNNHQNTKTNPNENFAREFFELFTIGKGPQIGDGDYTNYTEGDIEQAARVFTGFRARNNRDQSDPETGIPRGIVQFNQHDTGSKTFSSKFNGTTIAGATNANGMWTELDNFVNMVFAQPEVSRNFVRRLYRWFVNRNITPEIETDIIEPLATAFRTGNYEIKPIVQQLLQSQHFFDADDSDNADEIVGGMIKSPLEMTLQMISFFGLPIPSPTANPRGHYEQLYSTGIIQRLLMPAGLPIFFSNDVAGYPGYYQEPEYSRQWFNSSTIIPRYKFPKQLLTGRMEHGATPTASIFLQLNIVTWVRNSGFFSDPSDPYALVQELIEYLLPETLDSDRFNYFYNDVFLDNLPAADWTYEWQNYLSTNNLTEVKIPLEKLLNAIMYSPEFQTF